MVMQESRLPKRSNNDLEMTSDSPGERKVSFSDKMWVHFHQMTRTKIPAGSGSTSPAIIILSDLAYVEILSCYSQTPL